MLQEHLVHGVTGDAGPRRLLQLGRAAHVVGVAVRHDDAAHVVQGIAVVGQGVDDRVHVGGHPGVDERQAVLAFPQVGVDTIADLVDLPQARDDLLHGVTT